MFAGSAVLLLLFIVFGCIAYAWMSLTVSTFIFLPTLSLYLVGVVAYVLHHTGAVSFRTAVVLAWITVIGVVTAYHLMRVFVYRAVGTVLLVFLIPDFGSEDSSGVRVVVSHTSTAAFVIGSILIVVVGALAVFLMTRLLNATLVREIIVTLVGSKSFVLLIYLCTGKWSDETVDFIAVMPDGSSAWVWYVVYAALSFVRPIACRSLNCFCGKYEKQIATSADLDEASV